MMGVHEFILVEHEEPGEEESLLVGVLSLGEVVDGGDVREH